MIYLAPGGVAAAVEKYTTSIIYTPRALFNSQNLPLSPDQIGSLDKQIGDLTSRLREVYDRRNGNPYMNSWAISQIAISLNNNSVLESEDLMQSILETQSDTGGWKDVSTKRYEHIPATSWSLMGLRRTKFNPTKSLSFLIEAQKDDGAWSVYYSGDVNNGYSSTYATAWAVLALDAWSGDQRLSDQIRRDLDKAKVKGLDWLLKHRSTQSSLWLDYPENMTEGSPSVSVSSLVMHVFYRARLNRPRDDLIPLSAEYLDNLPRYRLTPWTKEVPGIVLVLAPNAPPETDTVRYYVLPWVVIATVDAYKYGGFRQRIEALRLVDAVIADLETFAEAFRAEERPWIAAEYLIALRYLAGENLL